MALNLNKQIEKLEARFLAGVAQIVNLVDPWSKTPRNADSFLKAVRPEDFAGYWSRLGSRYREHDTLIQGLARQMPLTGANIRAFILGQLDTDKVDAKERPRRFGGRGTYPAMLLLRRVGFTKELGEMLHGVIVQTLGVPTADSETAAGVMAELRYMGCVPQDSPAYRKNGRSKSSSNYASPGYRRLIYANPWVPLAELEAQMHRPTTFEEEVALGYSPTYYTTEAYEAMIRRFPEQALAIWPQAYKILGKYAVHLLGHVSDEMLQKHLPRKALAQVFLDDEQETRIMAAQVLGRCGPAMTP